MCTSLLGGAIRTEAELAATLIVEAGESQQGKTQLGDNAIRTQIWRKSREAEEGRKVEAATATWDLARECSDRRTQLLKLFGERHGLIPPTRKPTLANEARTSSEIT